METETKGRREGEREEMIGGGRGEKIEREKRKQGERERESVLPWWSTEGLEAWRILGMEKPMSSAVRASSFIKYGSCNTQDIYTSGQSPFLHVCFL